MRERDIERHAVKLAKAKGYELFKVQFIGVRGAPDRLLMKPERKHSKWDPAWRPAPGAICWAHDWTEPAESTWVEFKAPGVKPEAHQLRVHDRMRAMGQRVVVIDSIEGVEELLR